LGTMPLGGMPVGKRLENPGIDPPVGSCIPICIGIKPGTTTGTAVCMAAAAEGATAVIQGGWESSGVGLWPAIGGYMGTMAGPIVGPSIGNPWERYEGYGGKGAAAGMATPGWEITLKGIRLPCRND
jgi:hypothetical protein